MTKGILCLFLFGTAWSVEETNPFQPASYIVSGLQKIRDKIGRHSLDEIHTDTNSIRLSAQLLKDRLDSLRADKKSRAFHAYGRLIESAERLHQFADKGDSPESEIELAQMEAIWNYIRQQYPSGLLPVNLPSPLWTCPAHSQIHQTKTGVCPICGLALVPESSLSNLSNPTESEETLSIRALTILVQVRDSVSEAIQAGKLNAIHNEDLRACEAVSALSRQASPLQARLLTKLSRSLGDLHTVADSMDQNQTEQLWKTAQTDFDHLKSCFDPQWLTQADALAHQFICPMHPDEIGKKHAICPKCGMELSQPRRVLLTESNAPFQSPHTIISSIRMNPSSTPETGVEGHLYLKTTNGTPISFDDLKEVHTKKIHLLIIDPTLTDYHHEHPAPTSTPGEYVFRFFPKSTGPYRTWADLQPLATGFQEYAMTDIPGTETSSLSIDKKTVMQTSVGNLSYHLEFSNASLRTNQPVEGTLKIFGKDGTPFHELEPIMGTFAHIVGFNEDYQTVLHIHPMGNHVPTLTERGGPELHFQFYAPKPGFYRLFAQVQIQGVSQFAPFGIEVLP